MHVVFNKKIKIRKLFSVAEYKSTLRCRDFVFLVILDPNNVSLYL